MGGLFLRTPSSERYKLEPHLLGFYEAVFVKVRVDEVFYLKCD